MIEIAIFIVALGTYLMRFLPMKFNFGDSESSKEFFTLSSTSIISALFVTSTFTFEPHELSVRLLALILTALAYYKSRNFGISIIAAVLAYLFIKEVAKNFNLLCLG